MRSGSFLLLLPVLLLLVLALLVIDVVVVVVVKGRLTGVTLLTRAEGGKFCLTEARLARRTDPRATAAPVTVAAAAAAATVGELYRIQPMPNQSTTRRVRATRLNQINSSETLRERKRVRL